MAAAGLRMPKERTTRTEKMTIHMSSHLSKAQRQTSGAMRPLTYRQALSTMSTSNI